MPVISHKISAHVAILPVPTEGLKSAAQQELDFAVVIQPYEFRCFADGNQLDGSGLSPIEQDSARSALAAVWDKMHRRFAMVIRVKSAPPADSVLPAEDFAPIPVSTGPLGPWTWDSSARFGNFLSSFQVIPDDSDKPVRTSVKHHRPASLAAALESRRFVVEGSTSMAKPAGESLFNAAVGAAQIPRAAFAERKSDDAERRAKAKKDFPTPEESIQEAMRTFRQAGSLMRQNTPERYALGFCRRVRLGYKPQEAWPMDYWISLGKTTFTEGTATLELTPIGNDTAFWVHGVLRSIGNEWESRVADPLERLATHPPADQSPDPRSRVRRGVVSLASGFQTEDIAENQFASGDKSATAGADGVTILRINQGESDVPAVLEVGGTSWQDGVHEHSIVDVAAGWVAAVRETGGPWSELCQANVARLQGDAPANLKEPVLVPMTRGYQPFDLAAFGFVALSWIAPVVEVTGGKSRRILHYHYVLSTPSGDFLRSIPILNIPENEELWPTPPKNARRFEVLTALLTPGTWLYGEISEHNLPLASEGLLGFKKPGEATTLRALRRWDAGEPSYADVELDLFDFVGWFERLSPNDLLVAQGSWQLTGTAVAFQPSLAEYTGSVESDGKTKINVKTPEWPNETIPLVVRPDAQGLLNNGTVVGFKQLQELGRTTWLRLGFDDDRGEIVGFSERGTLWEGILSRSGSDWKFTGTRPSGTWPAEWADEAIVSETLQERRTARGGPNIAAKLLPQAPLPEAAEAEIEAVFCRKDGNVVLRIFRARFFPKFKPGMFVGFGHDSQGVAFADFRAIEYGINGEPQLTTRSTRLYKEALSGAGDASIDQLELEIPTWQLVRIEQQQTGGKEKITHLRPANDWMAGVISEIPNTTNDAPIQIVLEGLHSRTIRLTVEPKIAASLEVGIHLLFGRYKENKTGHLDMALLQGVFWWRGEQDAGSVVFYTLTGKSIVMALPIALAAGLAEGRSLVNVTYMVSASFGAVVEQMTPSKSAVLPLGVRVADNNFTGYFPIDSGFVRMSSGVADREVGISEPLRSSISSKYPTLGPRMGVKHARWQFRVRSINPAHRGVRLPAVPPADNTSAPTPAPTPPDVWLKCTAAPVAPTPVPGLKYHAVPCTVQGERLADTGTYGSASTDAFVAIAETTKLPAAAVRDGKVAFEVKALSWADIIAKKSDATGTPASLEKAGAVPRSASSGIVATGVVFDWHAGPIWGLASENEPDVTYHPLYQLVKQVGIHLPFRARRTYEFSIRLVDLAGNSIQLPAAAWGTLPYPRKGESPPKPDPLATPRVFLVGRTQVSAPHAFFQPSASSDDLQENNELAPGREGIGVTFSGPGSEWEICFLPPKTGFRKCEKAGAFDYTVEGETRAEWETRLAALYEDVTTTMGYFRTTTAPRLPIIDNPKVLKNKQLHYLPDPDARGFEIRFRHVIVGRDEKDWPIIKEWQWNWWPDAPNYWAEPKLTAPRLPRITVRASSTKPRLVTNLLGSWTILLPPGDRVTFELRSIHRHEDDKDKRWSSPYLLYHGTPLPAEPATEVLLPKPADKAIPGKFSGTWEVEIDGSTTGKIDVEWSHEIWRDDPEQPLPVVPWRYIEHWLDEPTTLDATTEPKSWDYWRRKISANLTAFDLEKIGLHPAAAAYLSDRRHEHKQPQFAPGVPFDRLGELIGALRDNGYTRNDDQRKNRWTLEGSVPLGTETHVRGRFRLSGQTRYERDYESVTARVLQEDRMLGRRLQLNHGPVTKLSVAYLVPLLHHPKVNTPVAASTGAANEYSQQVLQSGLRLYFQRPWFVSGPGEMAALLFHDDHATGTHWAVDPIWSGKKLRTAVKPSVDWQELDMKAVRVRPSGVTVPAKQPRDLTELEGAIFGDEPASVPDEGWDMATLRALLPGRCVGEDPWKGVVQPVRYAVDRGLWYADFWFPAPLVHGMFVRLVLARVQPFAENTCAFRSDPVVLYYCPLAGDRYIIARRLPGRYYRISYHGVFPPRPDQEKGLPLKLRVAISLHCRLPSHGESDPFGMLPCRLSEAFQYPTASNTSSRGRWLSPPHAKEATGQGDKPHWLELQWDSAKGEFWREFDFDRSLVDLFEDQPALYARELHLFVQEIQADKDAKVDPMQTPSTQSAISLKLPILS